ncbi:hypothetical protein [Saccharopolyspora elongata]|uniref:Uncharacterized protein n=1 Tax=Saccharopolyspora elongata TaxID=2530387 RepID=A0A4R4Y927_9PSEU|nr:hypothetical protein [Saccharopolyspora elongata]TDD40274.1 hypothetical protein E1288_35685 [Saccharopolyspora elongata]
MLEGLREVSCRDRAGRESDVVVGHMSSAVWLRVAGEERLLDLTQAKALHVAIGIQVAALQTVRREAVRG